MRVVVVTKSVVNIFANRADRVQLIARIDVAARFRDDFAARVIFFRVRGD